MQTGGGQAGAEAGAEGVEVVEGQTRVGAVDRARGVLRRGRRRCSVWASEAKLGTKVGRPPGLSASPPPQPSH